MADYVSTHTGEEIDEAVDAAMTAAKQADLASLAVRVAALEGKPDGGGSNVTITEDSEHVYINIAGSSPAPTPVPTIVVSTTSINLHGDVKSTTFSVSGFNLTGPITIGFLGAHGSFSVFPTTLQPVNGAVPSTDITATYSGSLNAGSTIVVASDGATSKSIAFNYTQGAAPALSITPSTLEISSAAGTQATGTLIVKGSNLVSTISLSSNAAGFSISPNTISASELNAAGNAGVEVVVTRAASATPTSATITAASGSLTASSAVSWSDSGSAELPSINDIISKDGVYYKVLSLPNGNTHGTVKLIHSSGEDINATNSSSFVSSTYSMTSMDISSFSYMGYHYDVVEIGSCAFANTNLASLTIGGTVRTIGNYAFYQTKIASITFADGIVSIGKYAFQNCGSLTSVTFSDTLTTLGDYAFSSCKFSSILIPDSVTDLGNFSFGSNTLTSITIGKTNSLALRSMKNPFYYAEAVTEIYCHYNSANGVISFGSYDGFKTAVKDQATLYVPTGAKTAFQGNTKWAGFARIVESTLLDN